MAEREPDPTVGQPAAEPGDEPGTSTQGTRTPGTAGHARGTAGHAKGTAAEMATARRPVAELIDLEALAEGGRAPSPARIRAALPRGWVLDADGVHARRDGRVFFRESWVLLSGLVVFGAAGLGLFWRTFPRGWGGVTRAVILLAVMLVLGGFIAPMVTRAVYRR